MPDNVTLDPPITNIERLLAKAAGMEGVSVDEPETRIERYLQAICDRLDSGGTGGSQLPDPTENDVGKVATVVDNSGTYEYGLETPSSSGGRFVVTFSYDSGTETWSTDKTFAECVSAWDAGQTLWAFEMTGDTGLFESLSSVFTNADGTPTYFAFYVADAESNVMLGYGIDAEGAYYYGN